ncbi:MAG: response regulator transcription factor [Acidimicrobiaceae bacterium]|nr:response regulator transcription factor [Acidimicrobiaceae bacterium]
MNISPRRILVVEDDIDLAQAVADLLGDEGFDVEQRYDGEAGLEAALASPFDIIMLDLMLPKRNGFSVCLEIREAGIQTPLLMLTAKNGELDEIEGLEVGADDFLRKPFEWSILLARINALLRRFDRGQSRKVVIGDVVLDTINRQVSTAGAEAKLTSREFRVLEYLMECVDRTVTKQEILDAVWGPDFDGDPNVVEVYVGYLRRKLDVKGKMSRIRTVRGLGYVFSSGV